MDEQPQHREIILATQWLPEEPDLLLGKEADEAFRRTLIKNTIQSASEIFQRRIAACTKGDELEVLIARTERKPGFELEITAAIKKGIRVRDKHNGHMRYRLYEKDIEPNDIVNQSISELSDVHRATIAIHFSYDWMGEMSDIHQEYLSGNIDRSEYLLRSYIEPEEYSAAADAMFELYRKIIDNRL